MLPVYRSYSPNKWTLRRERAWPRARSENVKTALGKKGVLSRISDGPVKQRCGSRSLAFHPAMHGSGLRRNLRLSPLHIDCVTFLAFGHWALCRQRSLGDAVYRTGTRKSRAAKCHEYITIVGALRRTMRLPSASTNSHLSAVAPSPKILVHSAADRARRQCPAGRTTRRDARPGHWR